MPIELPKSDKTEVYSFRTTPKILNDLKKYAKAKNTTVPIVMNTVFEDLFRDKTLTREKDYIIMTQAYKPVSSQKIDAIKKNDKKYIEHNFKWYEHFDDVYINNCLDVWKDDTYKSDNNDLEHEGLAILYKNNKTYYVKIDIYSDVSDFAYTISRQEAKELAKKSKNYDLLKFIEKNIPYSDSENWLEKWMKSEEYEELESMEELTRRINAFLDTAEESTKKYEEIKAENKVLKKKLKKIEELIEQM